MKHRRPFPSRAMRSHFGALLGVAAIAVALASATQASAGPNPGEKDHNGPGESGKGHPGDKRKGGLREMFGGNQPAGKDADGKRAHEHGAAGAPGMEGHHHGGPPEAMKKRFDELTQKETQGSLTADEKSELDRLKQFQSRHQTREQRKARLAELKTKEAAGKLSAEEKAELDKATQIQARHETLEQNAKQREESRKQRARDARRQALQEFPKLTSNAAATAEYRKYAERLAKLERAKELANADQNSAVATKIDALIAQENQRHQTWLTKNKATATGAAQ